MGLGTKIGLIVILLHLVVGFGYMVYILSPRAGDEDHSNEDESQADERDI